MAFPTIRNTNANDIPSSTSSFTVSLPYGHIAGDLLIIAVSIDGSRTFTTPTGWTLLANPTNTTANRLAVWYKIRGFTESNPVISMSGSELGTWFSIAISADTYLGTPEIATVYGVGNAPNAPSLTASWGSADNLWLAIHGWDYNRTSSTDPSGFTNLEYERNTSTSGTGIRAAYKNEASATVDPGSISISYNDTWFAHTIVIQPYAEEPYKKVYVNIGGTWKAAEGMWINVGGVWKPITSIGVNIGNIWKSSG